MHSIQFLILLIVFSRSLCSEQNQYCEMTNLPVCLNKTHILCKPKYTDRPKMPNTTIAAILQPMNDLRKDLRRYQFQCNLPDLKWNYELARIARETLNEEPNRFCYVTKDFKNLLYFNKEFSNKTDVNAIQNFLVQKTNMINPKPNEKNIKEPWLYSAYSTDIGCAETKQSHFHCMANGIELKYFQQSFGYENECKLQKSSIGNKSCNSYECNSHYILCNPYDIPSDTVLSLDFTAIKFILNKFDTNRSDAWDIDLQYFAEQIITKNLTANDKCLAQAQYSHMDGIHFNGVQYFSELISNIDNVWVKTRLDDKKIGCVAFNSTMENKQIFNLYCLTGNRTAPPEINFVRAFWQFIDFNESDVWLIYVLLILTYLDIFVALIAYQRLKSFERNRSLFSFNI